MVLTPSRLSKIIDNAFAKTRQQRQARVRFMTQMVGRFYRSQARFGDESSKASPVNLLNSAASTLIPNLVFNDPRAKVGTDLMVYRDYADRLGIGTTRVCQRSGLRDTLRMAIMDALLLAGFIKTGMAVGDNVIQFDGTDVNLTEPFAERVSPDDMILDPFARHWDEQAILGNRFRADVDKLIEVGYGDPDKLLKIAEDMSYLSKDKAEDITKAPGVDANSESRRYIDLAEVWLPAEKRVVTVPYKTGSVFGEFLNEFDYSGPPKGQYHMLGFQFVGDNLLPVAPAGIWYDLHILSNRIARKLARQAERGKRILAYEDEAEEDVNGIADSNDGETVRVQDINKIKEVNYGGATDDSYEWMNWVKQTFNEQTGQIGELGGTGESAPTLGQEQIQQANSTVKLGDMQNLVYQFTGKVMSDIAYYLHTDPLIELPLVRRVDGVEQQTMYSADDRVGEWFDYNITVEPYSMARTDPQTSVRRKLEFATNVIPAAAQAFQILGPGFKIGAFLTRIAKEVGIEDADEFLVTPEIIAWQQQQLLLSQMTGDPGKANPSAPASPVGPTAIPGVNPGQPNPTAMGPTGGISPSTEQAQAQQLATSEAQSSTKALALARGSL